MKCLTPDRRRQTHTRALRGLALTTMTFALAAPALAQSRGVSAAENARLYRQEVAACESGASSQSRAACLDEARSARVERRRGGLDTPEQSLQANALARCQVFQPGPDMEACRARVMGQGSVSGSVEGGGLLREYAVTIPVEPASSGMGAAPSAPTTAPSSTPPASDPAIPPQTQPPSPDPQTQQQMQVPPSSSSPMGAPGSGPRADTPMPPDSQPPMDPRMQPPINPQMSPPMNPQVPHQMPNQMPHQMPDPMHGPRQ